MAFVDQFAEAIAYAEGFYAAGSRAFRDNNPGNLTEDTTGKAVGRDGPFVVYGSLADGWEALRKQISMMLDGSSAFYSPNMSIAQVAALYTSTDPVAWARNVAGRLGVDVNSTLESLAAKVGAYGSVVVVAIVVLGALWALRKGL